MRWRYGSACLAIAAALLGACSRQSGEEKVAESKEPVKQYELRGEVKRLDAEARTAAIDHEKIGDWMEPMTMEFPVRDPNDFARLRTGERIKATVYVQGFRFWIGGVQPDSGPGK
jgi:Cu/Ag efflux protein CusF